MHFIVHFRPSLCIQKWSPFGPEGRCWWRVRPSLCSSWSCPACASPLWPLGEGASVGASPARPLYPFITNMYFMGVTLKLCKLAVYLYQCGLNALPSVQWLLVHCYHHFNLVLYCHLSGQWRPCQAGLLSCLHLSVSTSWLLCRNVLSSPRCPFVPAALVPGGGDSVGHQALAVCYGHTDAHRLVVPLTYLSQLALPMCVASDPDSEPGAQLCSTP